MNKPLIDSANMPGFEKPIDPELRARNQEYDEKWRKATSQWTEEMKKEAFYAMYWSVKPKENQQELNNQKELTNQQESEKQILEQKKEENPHTPLIDWFVKKGFLSVDEAELVKNALVNNNWIEQTIEDIKWLNSEKKKQIIDSIKFLDKKESKKVNQENFNKDFQNEIWELKQEVKWSKKWEKELVWQNKELIDKLWWNYFPIWQEWTTQEKNEALNVAFNTTLNQLMDWKNFKRPETFDQMKNTVKNPELDFKTRFNELKKIDNLIKLDQAKKISSQKKNYDNLKAWEESQFQTEQERFINIKQEVKIAIENKDKTKLQEIQEELNQIKEEETSWEVFEWWDIDKLLSETEQALKEQA